MRNQIMKSTSCLCSPTTRRLCFYFRIPKYTVKSIDAIESRMQRHSVLLMYITPLSYRRKRGAAVQVLLATKTIIPHAAQGKQALMRHFLFVKSGPCPPPRPNSFTGSSRSVPAVCFCTICDHVKKRAARRPYPAAQIWKESSVLCYALSEDLSFLRGATLLHACITSASAITP